MEPFNSSWQTCKTKHSPSKSETCHESTSNCVFLTCLKGKGSFYIAQYPVRWTAQSASHFLPSLTDLFIPTPFSASPGSILARQQLRAKTKSLTFPPLSTVRYSFIQLSQQGRQWRERKRPTFETVPKWDSNAGLHDCESGILPLSYRAPLKHVPCRSPTIDVCNLRCIDLLYLDMLLMCPFD